ncbi:MAG: HIT domain-containing protein [Proteobacteria bacterium]|jgi:ATP adenylyltransferase|nr:HIT domain-containing protein [Pseudomonadota bacterium]
MKLMFAPWRMKFILSSKKEAETCVLCDLQTQKDSQDNLILHRTSDSYIIINKFPYNTAHLMVVPNVHENDFTKLSVSTMTSIGSQLQKAVAVLTEVYKPAGFNIGMNLGQAAGAGIPKHLHWHIVPRWIGDNNFMPIVGGTKVLPETPEETYQRLKDRF